MTLEYNQQFNVLLIDLIVTNVYINIIKSLAFDQPKLWFR